MTCRRRPFEGKDIIDLAARVLKGEHRPVDDVCVRHIAARFLHGCVLHGACCVLHILSIGCFINVARCVVSRVAAFPTSCAFSSPTFSRTTVLCYRSLPPGTPHACGHLPPVSID
jgi:hypothetical protein